MKNNIFNIRPKIVILIIAIVLIIFFIIVLLINNHVKTINEDYPNLKNNEEIKGVVKNIDRYKAVVLIEFVNSNKKAIRARGFDKQYDLYEYLRKGDSLNRKAFNDTLFIFRKLNNGEIKEYSLNVLCYD